MNRRQRLRARVIERLHRSRLGWIGWLMDAAECLGCRVAGHLPFDDLPDMCRHCAATLGSRRP